MVDPVTGEIIDEKKLALQLLEQSREQGVGLIGPGGLLSGLTKTVLETALEAELTEHLGHEHGETPLGSNMRNGMRTKTVLTEIGPVEIEVPRDRDGSFEPVIVPKRKRRLDGIDEIVLSLTARGLTTGEIAAHFDDVYGATVSTGNRVAVHSGSMTSASGPRPGVATQPCEPAQLSPARVSLALRPAARCVPSRAVSVGTRRADCSTRRPARPPTLRGCLRRPASWPSPIAPARAGAGPPPP